MHHGQPAVFDRQVIFGKRWAEDRIAKLWSAGQIWQKEMSNGDKKSQFGWPQFEQLHNRKQFWFFGLVTDLQSLFCACVWRQHHLISENMPLMLFLSLIKGHINKVWSFFFFFYFNHEYHTQHRTKTYTHSILSAPLQPRHTESNKSDCKHTRINKVRGQKRLNK